jgi:hypothetical protein
MTVVVEAVVSTGCGRRVGAVTTMGGSSTTGDLDDSLLFLEALVDAVDFDGAAGLAGAEEDVELVPVDCANTGEPVIGMKTRNARALRWSFRRRDGGLDMMTCFLGSAAGQGRGFSRWKRGQKMPSFSPVKEMKAGRHRAEETPLPSCPWRDSSPDHTARDLMSAEKQVF